MVLGNCGFGFAPVRPDFRERSMLTMTRTEAIPYASMEVGMPWDWETIPEYLDSLDRTPKGVNCIQYMPTASLMTYVMGLEAAKTRPATDAERKEMQRLLREGMEAGLCGFSIQRLGPNSVQADFDGSPMVTDTMGDEDILALAEVLRERDDGFIQITQATGNIKRTWRSSRSLRAPRIARSCHNVIAPARIDPEIHRRPMRWIEDCRQRGLPIYAQCATVAAASRSRSRLESVRRVARLARGHHRHARREIREDAGSGNCARRWSTKPNRQTSACARSRPASAAIRKASSSSR